MSRNVFLWGIALYLLTVAFLLTDWLTFAPGVTERNCRRIRPGMTPAEVKGILGGDASDPFDVVTLSTRGVVISSRRARTWLRQERGGCIVYFNSQDLVESAEWDELGRVVGF